MKNLFKWALYGIGGLLVIAVVAGIAFALLFDANALRDDLTALVKKETGRELTINGDLDLAFFPWLGFSMQDASLSNAPGFGDEPFATIDQASARARLLPLLSRRLEIGKLTLDGLHLNLSVAKDGETTNWDDLAELGGGDAAAPADTGKSLQAQSIGGIELDNTSIRYRDASSGSDYQLRGGRIATGELRPGQPFTVEVGAHLESTSDSGTVQGDFTLGGVMNRAADTGVWHLNEPAGEMRMGGSALPVESLDVTLAANVMSFEDGRLRVDYPKMAFSGKGAADAIATLTGTLRTDSLWLTSDNELSMPQPVLELAATGGTFPGGKFDLSLNARALSGSLDSETFNLKEFSGTAQSIPFKGEMLIKKALSSPAMSGNVSVAQFSPLDLMQRLKIERPVTADPAVLKRASMKADFAVDERSALLSNLVFNLDDTTISGKAGLSDIASSAMRFDLLVDTINLDRYLEPAPEGGEQSGVAEDMQVPSDEIRDLDLEGTLKVLKMQLAGLRSTNVELSLKAKNGAVRVFPSRAELYGGTYSGDVSLNASGEKPVLTMNESLTNVQFGTLSQDLFQKQNLSGTVSGKVRLTGTGNEIGELRRTLNGDMDFNFVDGAYEGFNLWYEIAKAVALVKRETPPAVPAANRTVFSNMKGTAKVTDGILRNDDLTMLMPFISVAGNGEVNLPDQSVNYQINAQVIEGDGLDQVSAANDLVGYTIPVRVSGPIASPSVRPEVGPIIAQIIQRKGREQVEKAIGDKLGSQVSDLLGLGRAKDKPATTPAPATQPATTAATPEEAKPAEKPASLEDKLKKGLFDKLLGGDDKPKDDGNQ